VDAPRAAGIDGESETKRAPADSGADALVPVAPPATRALPGLSGFEVSILFVFLVYAALFIYQTSFVIDGVRYFCLFDDEMISMRYAANLAHYQGLVWNPGGERVLGFTNLLWVLYMSLFHLLPIPAAKMSLPIQVTGAAFLLATIVCVKKIAEELFPERRYVGALSMILTGFYGPLVNWSLQGTEVSFLALMVAISVLLALRSLQSDTMPLKLYLVLGASTLCRLDMAVFAGVLLMSLTVMRPENWKRHLLIGGSIVFAFLAAQGIFNFAYYGDPLPNTYYLKMTGYPLLPRLKRGLEVTWGFIFPLLPLIVAVVAVTPARGRFAGTAILGAAVLGQVAYSVWVGGDIDERRGGANRFVAIAMPLFFVLLAFALTQYASLIRRFFADRLQLVSALENRALALFVGVALFLPNASSFRVNFLLVKPTEAARPEPGFTIRMALFIRSVSDRNARIAVVSAGILPYFADRYAIDLLGKCDAKVAHEEMHRELQVPPQKEFWPGHLKWDYAYSIGELKPDLVVQTWGVAPDTIPELRMDYAPLIVGGEFLWFARRESTHLRGLSTAGDWRGLTFGNP